MEKAYTHKPHLRGFLNDQDGAVTVDWVVLTAGIVFLGMAAAFTVSANIPGLADEISDTVASTEVVPSS